LGSDRRGRLGDRVNTRISWSRHRMPVLGHATWHLYRKVVL
jgi:hypothetical protein